MGKKREFVEPAKRAKESFLSPASRAHPSLLYYPTAHAVGYQSSAPQAGLQAEANEALRALAGIIRRHHPRGAVAPHRLSYMRIRDAKLARFTVDRLMEIVGRVGSRIEVRIKLRPAGTIEHAGHHIA